MSILRNKVPVTGIDWARKGMRVHPRRASTTTRRTVTSYAPSSFAALKHEPICYKRHTRVIRTQTRLVGDLGTTSPESTPSPQSLTETNPMPQFDDTQSAFASKTITELLTAAVAFSLCQCQPLVKHAEQLLTLFRRIGGDRLTDGILKVTLFSHFCAGEDETRIQPAIAKLNRAGVGSILDFAAEEDDGTPTTTVTKIITHSSSGLVAAATSPSFAAGTKDSPILQQNHPNVRMYDYESEANCDRHLETFRKCIQAVGNLQQDGFAAIKVTALGNPKLLVRMSRAIVEAQNLFAKFDEDGDGFISLDEFERGLDIFFIDKENIHPWIDRIKRLMPTSTDASLLQDKNRVDFITWTMLLSPTDLPNISGGLRMDGPLAFCIPTAEEAILIANMYDRGRILAQEAAACGTRLLVDAEQVRFQPAIDNLVLELQRTYNSAETASYPIIYNTYQCYLKDASKRLQTDVERSRRYNYHFGAKLVRGAYMESERALAKSLGVPSPIHETIEDTHSSYNNAVEFLLRYSLQSNQSTELMCATHNQQTIELAIEAMNKLGIDRAAQVISFAQLYGMKDNLTFNLGRNGFRAYKYVPYGPIKMVMPYLLRRANENSAIAGGASGDQTMIIEELKRRLFARK